MHRHRFCGSMRCQSRSTFTWDPHRHSERAERLKDPLATKEYVCHFDRRNLSQQMLEWRNLAVYLDITNDKISPLRSFLAPVEMTQYYIHTNDDFQKQTLYQYHATTNQQHRLSPTTRIRSAHK